MTLTPETPPQTGKPSDFSRNAKMTVRQILFLYGVWIAFSTIVRFTKELIPLEGTALGTARFLVITGFTVMASLMTGVFIGRIHPMLEQQPGLRKALLIGAGVTIFSLFGVARINGYTSDWIYFLNTANLLIFANLLGSWMVAPLTRPAELIPLAVLVSLVDIFSVVSGPTRKIATIIQAYYKSGMKGPVPLSDFILIKFPLPGVSKTLPVFGVSDWIIIAFFTAAAFKFRLKDNLIGKGVHQMVPPQRIAPYFSPAALGLLIGIGAAHYFGIFVPALPTISLTFLTWMVVCHSEMRMLRKSDWRLLGGTVVIMGVLMSLRYRL